jgi:hypothetical protein
METQQETDGLSALREVLCLLGTDMFGIRAGGRIQEMPDCHTQLDSRIMVGENPSPASSFTSDGRVDSMSGAVPSGTLDQRGVDKLTGQLGLLRLDFMEAIRLSESDGNQKANFHLLIALSFLDQIREELSVLHSNISPT